MPTLIDKLREARIQRWLKLTDPVTQRFEFCPVWANFLNPPAPVQVDTSVGTLVVATGVIPGSPDVREGGRCEYSFPFTADELVAFHPPSVVVAHYNEFAQVAANVGVAFVAVVPDGRVVENEWGEMQYDAYFFAPADSSEAYEVQMARVAGVRMGLKELWGEMINFVEYIPKFSERAAWESGEGLLRGEWFAIRLTLNIRDYELVRM